MFSYFDWEFDEERDARVQALIDPWIDTPYGLFQFEPGPEGAVDCVRFVFGGVIDKLYGRTTNIAKLPPDAAFHAPDKARAAMKKLLRQYEPWEDLTSGIKKWRAGDVVVVPPSGAVGPGHAIIAGANRVFYHTTKRGVRSATPAACVKMLHRYRALGW